MRYVDETALIELRRRLHEVPELGYELEKTCGIVREELAGIGLSATDRFLPGSLVCDLPVKDAKKTIAIRADMDALPITEETGLPYASKNAGRMHACGHDAHTACVLAAARALAARREELRCSVRFIFQPNEEGAESVPPKMIRNGVLNGVDEVIGFHVDNALDCGKIGFRKGPFMASCRNFTIRVSGRTSHVTEPEKGADALAAAAQIYALVQSAAARRVSPAETSVCSVCSLRAGNAHNVIPDRAEMLGTIRTYSAATDVLLYSGVREIAARTAECFGCAAEVTSTDFLVPLVNDPEVTDRIVRAAEETVGRENVTEVPRKTCSEDFADFSACRPCAYFHLGTGKPGSERPAYHRSDFVIEERALKYAADTIVRFVLNEPC